MRTLRRVIPTFFFQKTKIIQPGKVSSLSSPPPRPKVRGPSPTLLLCIYAHNSPLAPAFLHTIFPRLTTSSTGPSLQPFNNYGRKQR